MNSKQNAHVKIQFNNLGLSSIYDISVPQALYGTGTSEYETLLRAVGQPPINTACLIQ